MRKILGKKFFSRGTLRVAEDLLGKFLVREYRGKKNSYMIIEVEAYDGFEDKASHAHRGKTARNEIMFGEGGFWYVYLIYGMYYMLNITIGVKEYPAAILIRGLLSEDEKKLEGPGKICRDLKIDKKLHKKEATQKSGLWIEDRGTKVKQKDIEQTPRIGVLYAGKTWAEKPYRFLLKP